MNSFASGPKKSYYGMADVIVYRLNRDGQPEGGNPVFGARVHLLIYGDEFWPAYTQGDNTNLIATDSMKNFIERETMNFEEYDLESYCRFIADKFMSMYPQVQGAQVTASQIPYDALPQSGIAFTPSGPERARASIEITRSGIVEMKSGIEGFRLVRLNGGAFSGFVRDRYTSLPEARKHPMHMWLDLDWTYSQSGAAFTGGRITRRMREIVRNLFARSESGSIQQILYQTGERILAEFSTIAEVHLEASDRTWATVAEQGDSLGVYSDGPRAHGCLGLTLRR